MKRDINTKPSLASQIVSELGITCSARVIDLGCGNGVFMRAVIERMLQSAHCAGIMDDIAHRVIGIEVSAELASKAICELTATFGEPARGWNVYCRDALYFEENQTFDFVVGNPPWVRVHDLDQRTKSRFRSQFELAHGAFNLCYLFIEKSVRLLRPGGVLALVVPQTIEVAPASARLRRFLTREGDWSVTPLYRSDFVPEAQIRPVLLTLRKYSEPMAINSVSTERLTLGSLARITTGVPTGMDKLFIVNHKTVQQWELEPSSLKKVVRGRDVVRAMRNAYEDASQSDIIWPYVSNSSNTWCLHDMSDAPNVLRYLVTQKGLLSSRPRLVDYIKRHPDEWYRFIDPNRHSPVQEFRIVMPQIFKRPAFLVLTDPDVVIHNSCFQLVPKIGCRDTLLRVLNDRDFWELLKRRSRRIANDFRQTTASELGQVPLESLAEPVI